MEVIQLAGYTEEEKLQIAKRYLVPRQIERNGVKRSQLVIHRCGAQGDHRGVHARGRRAAARARDRLGRAQGRPHGRGGDLEGQGQRHGRPRARAAWPRRFFYETRRRLKRPGVATGLAWTPVGGDVLFIEATAMPGKGRLTITGQLGEVMRESAEAALSYVRSNVGDVAAELPDDWFAEHDLHIHVPAGATPKDGPSAGITIATALVSLVSERIVRADVAMTGEITLTGQVLPIGGLKEKSLAAQRYGVKCVIAPALNEQDLDEFPEHLKREIEFVFVDEMEQVLEAALAPARSLRRGRARSGSDASGSLEPRVVSMLVP